MGEDRGSLKMLFFVFRLPIYAMLCLYDAVSQSKKQKSFGIKPNVFLLDRLPFRLPNAS